MKKLKYLFTALFVLCITVANAEDFAVDGIYYKIISEEYKTVEVTFRGNSYDSYNNEYSGNVIILESVTYNEIIYSVTSIESCAFSYCTGLTSIEIPNSVTSIGNSAFSYCTGLTSIVIPNSVTAIGNNAFNGCTGFTNFVIPNSVTSIDSYAFSGCTGLTNITIPTSVTSIGLNAFSGCTNLKTVINFSNLTFSKGSSGYGYIARYADKVVNAPNAAIVGDFVFAVIDGVNTLAGYLGNNTEITLPENYNGENYVIGENAFNGNTTITNIVIPNCVTGIGNYAFLGCSKLTNIKIPNSITSIGKNAFYNCGSLAVVHINNLSAWCNIEFNGGFSNPLSYARNLYLNGKEVAELVIPNGVTKINNYAFFYCLSFTSVIIPNSVTSIGYSAFEKCYNLDTVINFSNLTFTQDSENTGYVAYYAFNVINAPNGEIVDDFVFGKLDGINTLVAYLGDDTGIVLPENYNGENYAIGEWAFDENQKKVYLLSKRPPTVSDDFSMLCFENTTIYVPKGTLEAYYATWTKFWDIREYDTIDLTAVEDVDAETEKVVYDLKGNRILDTENLERGVYIINNKKVLVK